MAISNRTYALLELAQWCRHHGVIEIREAFAKGVALANAAKSNEEVAMMLEQVALMPEAPAPAVEEAVVTTEETKTKPRTKAKTSG